MFSVVIPLYNKEDSISYTLNSVLKQTFDDFEIIVVNDGSRDRSREIVLSIDDPRIKLIDQENAGVSAARNRGIREARYDWIAFLDADDLWKINKLEEVAEVIMSNNISWLVTGLETIKGSDRREFLYSKNGFLSDALDDLLLGLYIQTSSVVVRRNIFLQNDNFFFKEGINHSEDREVWYKLIFYFPRLFYLNKVLATYIRDTSGNSLTSSSNIKFNFTDLERRLHNDLKNLPTDRAEKFKTFLFKFNRRASLNIWILKSFKDEMKVYFSKYELWILNIFEGSPRVIKKIVSKVL